MSKKVVFIGSINMDMKHTVEEFPEEGTNENTNEILETEEVLGGKGANQAVATFKQSKDVKVSIIGCVGKDEAGLAALTNLKDSGVDISGVKVLEDKKTDGRIITVDKRGENRMIGYGDCIKQLLPDMIDEEKLKTANIIAIQLKMPAQTVKYVINFCQKHNIKLVIDPTPPDKSAILVEEGFDLLKQATYLTPNEEEAFALIKYAEGKSVAEWKKEFQATQPEERLKLIEEFVRKYPNVIATVGGAGVIYNRNGKAIRKATYPTVCKDSTGAGDTFNGGFIGAMTRDEGLDSAIEYGLMSSSIKVRESGAQKGVPYYEETKKAINKAKLKEAVTRDDD